MGSLYFHDESDDFIGPNPEEVAQRWIEGVERAKAERLAHTYRLKCGDVSFECHLKYSSPKDGRLWVKMEVRMLPDDMIPPDISRSTLDRSTTKLGWHGYIESDFIQDENGMFIASEHWMQKFEKACEWVRRTHRIMIEGEEYYFPVEVIDTPGPNLEKATANVNGNIRTLVRDLGQKCWVLGV